MRPVLLITILAATVTGLRGQAFPALKFKSNGEFKIVQFTDIHWSSDPQYTDRTAKTIRHVLQQEQPDLIVLTGDNVNATPMRKGWQELAAVISEANTPWTAVFGNHDGEQDFSKQESLAFLKTFPLFFGDEGPVHGVGNFSVPVRSTMGKDAAVLYFMDSNDYTRNPKLGSYDWIKRDQIQWYTETGNKYTAAAGKVLPSLMFFHIPLVEYGIVAKDSATVGNVGEDVSSSEVNSGLFAALLEQKDVMATFTGHDHDNNFIGTYKGIALAYGNKTGSDGYGDLPQGARVIVLKENKFAFTTYIRTVEGKNYTYRYPAALPEITASANVLKAVKIKPHGNGLRYTYSEGIAGTVADIAKMKPISQGVSKEIGLQPAQKEDHFALTYSGYIEIPETDYYRFYSYSDDGSVVKIDGQIIVNNDGGHSAQRREGTVALEKGFHKIEILYFEDYMGQVLEVGLSSVAIPEQVLSPRLLFH